MKKLELEDLVEFSKTIKVLYVDGNYEHRNSALSVFKIFFHHIDTAHDGIDGLKHFQENKYNIIITDISMGKMNGIDMISKIREISNDISILVMSEDDDTMHFMDLIKLGIDGYILKPVKVKQFVDVMQKVIEKFKNKQELYEYKNTLENMVKKKTIELSNLNNRLQERVEEEVQKNMLKKKKLFEQSKMVAMGELLSNISHQWTQPLSCITTGVTGMHLQKELGLLEDKEFFKICKSVNENAQLLSKTIENFREYIKEDSHTNKFLVSEAIDSFLVLVSATTTNNHIQIEINIDKDITVFGNKNELQQSLLHLFNNSNDIFGSINTPRYIHIKANTINSKTLISFQDNAGGVDSEIIDKIFEPYFTTKYRAQGIGLGLSSVYNIIENKFKGTIEIENTTINYENKPYLGAKFTLTLPSVE